MASTVENDQEDCQMQPLDLSCPKTDAAYNSTPRSRPRSSSGGSEESLGGATEFDSNRHVELVKAAALLRNCWPQASAIPPILLDGPARKRFLTKYLHKNGKLFIIFQDSLLHTVVFFANFCLIKSTKNGL